MLRVSMPEVGRRRWIDAGARPTREALRWIERLIQAAIDWRDRVDTFLPLPRHEEELFEAIEALVPIQTCMDCGAEIRVYHACQGVPGGFGDGDASK